MIPDSQVNLKVKQWLTDLLRHKQSKANFIRPAQIRELRDLMRYRKTLIQERTQQINHLQKVLETANFKHSNMACHISSASRQKLAVATAGGEDNKQALAELAYQHNKVILLRWCQTLDQHQRCLISTIISHVDFLEDKIQNIQIAIERRILPSEETSNLLNIIPAAKQIDSNFISSDTSIDIYRSAYEKHFAQWTGVCPDNRQSSSKPISGHTTQHVILHELTQIITQDRNLFLSTFYDRQARRLGKKRAIIALAHKMLFISYHVLKNNKFHQELALNYYEQPDTMRLQHRHGYRFGQLVVNCCISICLMGGLALISHSPFVFPSLGPTVFLFFYKPTDPSSSPRNILIGHSIATIVGYLSLVATGLAAAGPALAVGVTWPRIIAIGLSLGLTVGLMVLLRAPHPPATATTLIISLGTLTKPWQLLVLMLAVVLLTVQALIINRLAGIDYPLWRSQPAQTALC